MKKDRVKLTIYGISYSAMQQGAFALLLAEEGGPYRIPVVIGAPEAQSIAAKIEGVMPLRPMTHDLFCNFARAYGIELVEVFISRFEDGIFFSEMRFNNGERELLLDARTSDAVAIAIRTGAPIYTTREILLQTGTIFRNDNENTGELVADSETAADSEPEMNEEQLQERLNELIENEEYEEAAKVSAMLNKLRGQNPK